MRYFRTYRNPLQRANSPLLTAIACLALVPLLVSPIPAQETVESAPEAAPPANGLCPELKPGADLRTCEFAYRSLSGMDLAGVDLRGVNLAFADLTDARLTRALLDDALLTSATLRGADLTAARAHGADLRLADLSGASVESFDVAGAELSNAIVDPHMLEKMHLEGAVLPEGYVCRNLSCPVRQRQTPSPRLALDTVAP